MRYLGRPRLFHVAARNENRGRVVLIARTGAPETAAVNAAMRVARAYDASVECVLVACADTVQLSGHGFARQVTHSGRIVPLDRSDVLEQHDGQLATARTAIVAAANRAGVPITTTIVRDGLTSALRVACAEQGPWNIVVLADAVQPIDTDVLAHWLEGVADLSGIVLAGERAKRDDHAPVGILADSTDALAQMVRVAERFALESTAAQPLSITLITAGRSPEDTAEIDAHARLFAPAGVTDHGVPLRIARVVPSYGTAAEIAESVRLAGLGWLIVRDGGLLSLANRGLAELMRAVRLPILVMN